MMKLTDVQRGVYDRLRCCGIGEKLALRMVTSVAFPAPWRSLAKYPGIGEGRIRALCNAGLISDDPDKDWRETRKDRDRIQADKFINVRRRRLQQLQRIIKRLQEQLEYYQAEHAELVTTLSGEIDNPLLK